MTWTSVLGNGLFVRFLIDNSLVAAGEEAVPSTRASALFCAFVSREVVLLMAIVLCIAVAEVTTIS